MTSGRQRLGVFAEVVDQLVPSLPQRGPAVQRADDDIRVVSQVSMSGNR